MVSSLVYVWHAMAVLTKSPLSLLNPPPILGFYHQNSPCFIVSIQILLKTVKVHFDLTLSMKLFLTAQLTAPDSLSCFLVTYSVHLEIRNVFNYISPKYLSTCLVARYWGWVLGEIYKSKGQKHLLSRSLNSSSKWMT